MYDKNTRILYLFKQLLQNNYIEKEHTLQLLEIDQRTFERDLATIRNFLGHQLDEGLPLTLDYNATKRCYYLSNDVHSQLSKKDILMMIKLLLGSRALCKEEFEQMVECLIRQLPSEESKEIEAFIRNECHHYIPLKHGKKLIDMIWEFSEVIEDKRAVMMEYTKADLTTKSYIIHPVGLVFTDYYFYAVSYVKGKEGMSPISFRLDRINSYTILEEHFKIPYSERFEPGDFHNKINLMYQGELIKFTFRFTGHSVEAVLDKFPISRVIEEGDGYVIIEAISYEQGLLMWLFSQGEWIKVLSPNHLVDKVKTKLQNMIALY